MQSKAATVKQYLKELPENRRSAIETVRAVILQNLDPEFEEGMQYGMIGYYVPHRVYPPGYHCDPRQPLPFVCLASQKNYMSVYLGCICGHSENERWFHKEWAKTGKKLDMGRSCLRFRTLEDLALEVIGKAIRRVPVRTFIDFYETVIKGRRLPSKNTDSTDRSSKSKVNKGTAKSVAAKPRQQKRSKAAG